MVTKCMLAFFFLTCFTILIIIILSNMTGDDNIPRPMPHVYINPDKEPLKKTNKRVRLLDFENFEYLIEPYCNYTNEFFEELTDPNRLTRSVWLITSYAGDVTKRSIIRQAYSTDDLRSIGIRRIFLLGSLSKEAQRTTGITQQAIENEAYRFKDILQGNFVEAYKNLTYKHIMGLKWGVEGCSRSFNYIIKMDDDIIVNLYEAISLMKTRILENMYPDFMMGHVMYNMAPIRNPANKWYVTKEEYPKDEYPPFVSGWFYVIDMLTALKLLYRSQHHTKYFWIDDLFVTGILREEAGINYLIGVNDYFATDYRFLECCLKDRDKLKYKCDFIVGPDGGERDLLLRFQNHSEYCYRIHNCEYRPNDKLLKDKCILEYTNYNLDAGKAQVKLLPDAN